MRPFSFISVLLSRGEGLVLVTPPPPTQELERRRRRAEDVLQRLRLDALVVPAVAQIGEARGRGWLAYFFGYYLHQRHAYGLIGAHGQIALVLPSSLKWTARGADLVTTVVSAGERPLAADVVDQLRSITPTTRRPQVGVLRLQEMMPVVDYLEFSRAGFDLVEVDGHFEPLRAVKTTMELEEIEHSLAIAERGMRRVTESLAVGTSMRDLGAAVTAEVLRAGARDVHLLVATGTDGSCSPFFAPPQAVDVSLQKDDVVAFSIELAGPGGYWVEHAQTFPLGMLDPQLARMIELSTELERLFTHVAVPGRSAGAVTDDVRRALTSREHALGHALGHGIGQDIVEAPRLVLDERQELAEGMTLAFHPHIVDRNATRCAYSAAVYRVEADGARRLRATSERKTPSRVVDE